MSNYSSGIRGEPSYKNVKKPNSPGNSKKPKFKENRVIWSRLDANGNAVPVIVPPTPSPGSFSNSDCYHIMDA